MSAKAILVSISCGTKITKIYTEKMNVYGNAETVASLKSAIFP
jgi:hypothetical protein